MTTTILKTIDCKENENHFHESETILWPNFIHRTLVSCENSFFMLFFPLNWWLNEFGWRCKLTNLFSVVGLLISIDPYQSDLFDTWWRLISVIFIQQLNKKYCHMRFMLEMDKFLDGKSQFKLMNSTNSTDFMTLN